MRSLKLGIVSDLHLDSEFSLPSPDMPRDLDAFIIAGDLSSSTRGSPLVRRYLEASPFTTIVVAGNHDYYHQQLADDESIRRAVEIRQGIHYLQRGYHDIREFRILGTTLWASMDWGKHVALLHKEIYRLVSCPRYIRTEGPFVEAITEHYRLSLQWLEEQVQVALDEQRIPIVVTHFAPSLHSLHFRYRGQLLNPYFINNLPDTHPLFQQVPLWVHGHTHSSFDYRVGNCRVVCNPRGYLQRHRDGLPENPDYSPSFHVQVEV